jgi:hypothetical protein
MSPSEKFRKFAGECRAMAKFARSPESKATWDGLAERWVQCAELNELRWSTETLDRMARRHRRPIRSWTMSDGGRLEPADLSRE